MSEDHHDEDQTQSFVPLTEGTEFGHYRIISRIGAGGMGEVYLAEDTKLNRKVALKFMPVHMAGNADMRARFTREAQAAAKLDHPNIVPVFEVGEYQGRPYFAMAHIEGKSLREVIREGKLGIDDAVDLTMQILEGLQEAHEAGIVHRDIKPGNIIIDSKGRPRLVDFGLATVSGEEKLTKTGSTLGTVGYMSPEQVEGKKCDSRSDLFSVGVILYEMLTGHRPFEGDNDAAIVRAITDSTPEPVARYKSGTTGEIQQIIDKALSKDPSIRYQTASGMLADLRRPDRILRRRTPRNTGHWLSLAAAAIVIIGAVYFFAGKKESPWMQYDFKGKVTFSGLVRACELSPDGRFLAYVEGEGAEGIDSDAVKLYVLDLDGGKPNVVLKAYSIHAMCWSSDGTKLFACATLPGTDLELFSIPPFGGEPREYLPPERSPYFFQVLTISENSIRNRIAMTHKATPRSIAMIDIATGEESYLTVDSGISSVSYAVWSPDGSELLVTAVDTTGSYVLAVIDPDNGQLRVLLKDRVYSPRWSTDGSSVFYVSNQGSPFSLCRQAYDSHSKSLKGDPEILIDNLVTRGSLSISSDMSRVVLLRTFRWSNINKLEINGSNANVPLVTPVTSGTSWIDFPSVSPDGSQIAFSMQIEKQTQVYVTDRAGEQIRQLTFRGDFNSQPVWSYDGKTIAYISRVDSVNRIAIIGIDGRGEKLLDFTGIESRGSVRTLFWTPDDNILALTDGTKKIVEVDVKTGSHKTAGPYHPEGLIRYPLYTIDMKKLYFNWLFWTDTATFHDIHLQHGIWSYSPADSTLEWIHERAMPIGWSDDGEYLYYWQKTRRPVNRFSLKTGNDETVMILPKEHIEWISLFPDKESLVYVDVTRSDDVVLYTK